MLQSVTIPQDTQPVRTIESETVPHNDHELLIPIAEYASRESLSRRTVDRYVRFGRLEKVKQHGQTYILDKPLKPPPRDLVMSDKVPDSQIVPFVQTDWIRLGYLQARSRAKTAWQIYAILLTVLFVCLLLASLWLFAHWRFLTSHVPYTLSP